LLRRILIALGVCVLAAVLTGFIYAGTDWSLYMRVWTTAVLWYLNMALLTPAVLWVVHKTSYERTPKILFFVIHILAGSAFAAILTILAFVDLRIYADPDIVRYLNSMYPQYFNIGVFIYAALTGWLYMLEYQRRSRAHAVREAELTRLAREAELRALKAQINPHFLFNALNSVNALVAKDPEGAREMNTRLGNMLRYVLDGSEKQFVTVREELDFVTDYLKIEKLRLGDKLSVDVNVDERVLDSKIPPMTLEPIVENAIKHGVAKNTSGGTIGIKVRSVRGQLECRVHDTGGGVSAGESESVLDRGRGLKNTLERLKRLYEDAFSFSIESNPPSGCTVTLSIPLSEGRP
jgi:sensor histidine kinase YesM